ncbi:hypothetical protein [Pseudomonas sp. R5(2019)]|uniref:hypothetical protein n=1 Tax=Pseudomonas sp. R5(2019) TaxID=2697566 RepID=UPI001411F415|nr:hypothetical protein [Pseudomonas sp. R5(2019)]NBA95322.1 hypothetical protein [Pseudomonas sp. R5(2019)]
MSKMTTQELLLNQLPHYWEENSQDAKKFFHLSVDDYDCLKCYRAELLHNARTLGRFFYLPRIDLKRIQGITDEKALECFARADTASYFVSTLMIGIKTSLLMDEVITQFQWGLSKEVATWLKSVEPFQLVSYAALGYIRFHPSTHFRHFTRKDQSSAFHRQMIALAA